jgi:hypothetical protein
VSGAGRGHHPVVIPGAGCRCGGQFQPLVIRERSSRTVERRSRPRRAGLRVNPGCGPPGLARRACLPGQAWSLACPGGSSGARDFRPALRLGPPFSGTPGRFSRGLARSPRTAFGRLTPGRSGSSGRSAGFLRAGHVRAPASECCRLTLAAKCRIIRCLSQSVRDASTTARRS